ncbi:hypothetical protein CC1G_00586 [Coprinopsis cinerea okayama7|uniref:F-box domain-containing protein n=1 Tax=Coprinopsis cinerea (strain Okayama-7 / 130 / ATCC MYA-4618 / FGSC 9003) TaxID=240176 RepID=A8N3R5_COPC7|nr:hypothetical protein CC1G_00586 [Coprinopsis cinerea okayama7\|eukprot:XP_001829407.2 hypothetical protein CC1G_00586 [Coprinopsis cinerea okayama7\
MLQELQPSTQQSRLLRQRKKPRYDLDSDSEDEDRPKRLPKRHQRSPSNKRQKRRGKLATFVNLPLDILHEIFSHLHPYELLKLARTTKDFRRILMHKSSISTWRASFSELHNLPPCPPGMPEPAWANLCFSPHCHICLTPGVRNVEWRFRIRMCAKCAPNHLIETYPLPSLDDLNRSIPGGFDIEIQNLPDIRYLLPNREGKRFKRVFMLEDLINFRDKFKALQTPEERLAFIDEQRKATEALNLHATNCAAWSHNQADDRSDELSRLRQERRQAIIKKLEQLGYKKDLQSIMPPDSLERQPFASKPQRLTERIWNNIKPAAIKFMDQMREKRLQRELEELAVARKASACQYLQQVKNSLLPCSNLLPEPPDFCLLPGVTNILRKPLDVDVDASTFAANLSDIQGMFATWRKDVVLPRLRQMMFAEEVRANVKWESADLPKGPAERPDSKTLAQTFTQEGKRTISMAGLEQKMKLANTVYACRHCPIGRSESVEYPSYFGFQDRLLFYPHVLGHPCLTRNRDEYYFPYLGPSVKHDAALYLENSPGTVRTRWCVGNLAVDKKASEIAALVIQRVGLDPATATTDDMDRLDPWFHCAGCMPHMKRAKAAASSSDSDDDPDFTFIPLVGYYNWRRAIKHQLDLHTPRPDPRDLFTAPISRRPSPPLSVGNLIPVSPNDSVMEKIKHKEHANEMERAEIWCCAHCRDLPRETELCTWPSMKEHLAKLHNLEDPVLDRDYFKHYAACDLMTHSNFTVLIEQNVPGFF